MFLSSSHPWHRRITANSMLKNSMLDVLNWKKHNLFWPHLKFCHQLTLFWGWIWSCPIGRLTTTVNSNSCPVELCWTHRATWSYSGEYHSWLVVWLPFFIFPYIGNNHPNWLIFFRGVAQPPTTPPHLGSMRPVPASRPRARTAWRL